MATLRDAAQLTEELEELAARLRSELTDGDVDFTAMTRLADDLGERADALASAFAAMDEALMQRLPGQAEQGAPGDDGREEGRAGRPRRQRQRRQEPAQGGDDQEADTKEELLERARDVGIEGRSAMSKDELRKAVEAEESLSKEELLERARQADIPGRSEMTKEELREALRSA